MSSFDKPILNKVVRPKVVQLRQADGWIVEHKILTELSELLPAYISKLAEEILEFKTAQSRISEIEEVADLKQLLMDIRFHFPDGLQNDGNYVEACEIVDRHTAQHQHLLLVERVRLNKFEKKGGFQYPALIISERRAD